MQPPGAGWYNGGSVADGVNFEPGWH